MAGGITGLLRRPIVWVGLLVVVLLVGLGVGIGLGWTAAMQRSLMSRRCVELEHVDLETKEIVSLKKRWHAYARSDAPDASMRLSPREATWLLRAESDLGLTLTADGDVLEAIVTVPADGGCYNVDYRGGVVVHDGLAVLDVDKLAIGGTDLSDLAGLGGALGGARQAVSPEDLVDPRLSELLANIEHMTVSEGELHVRFVEPRKVWR